MGIDAVYLHETDRLKAGARIPMPVMSVEVLQLRAALDYWMKMTDDYEKLLRELQLECDAAYREIDRLNAVVAAYESQVH